MQQIFFAAFLGSLIFVIIMALGAVKARRDADAATEITRQTWETWCADKTYNKEDITE